jgi:hypothetical protein
MTKAITMKTSRLAAAAGRPSLNAAQMPKYLGQCGQRVDRPVHA